APLELLAAHDRRRHFQRRRGFERRLLGLRLVDLGRSSLAVRRASLRRRHAAGAVIRVLVLRDRAHRDHLRAGPAIIHVNAGITLPGMAYGIPVGLLGPGTFLELDAAVFQQRALAEVDFG